MYEQFRDMKTPQAEKEKLLFKMQKLSSTIKTLVNIELIKEQK